MLTLALPKGRLAEESIEILLASKFLQQKPDEKSKELAYTDLAGKLKIFLVRAQDVPVYVEKCAADAGIIGWDTLKEGIYDLIVPLDLKIGKCRLSLASFPNFSLQNIRRKIKVATKYPRLAKEYFFSKGISCEIIKLYGSIELAPICSLSDCIVDLVSTGETLRANGLQEMDIILESSARLVFNRSSLYRNRKECVQFIDGLSRQLPAISVTN